MKPGTKVIKNPATWIVNEFDSWGRGEGIGYVMKPPFPLGRHELDVRWPEGRCFENRDQVLRMTKKTVLSLSKKQLKRLKYIMSIEYYTPREGLADPLSTDCLPYKKQLSLRHEAHDIMDLIRLSETEKKKMWMEHHVLLRIKSNIYQLTPIQDRRDNKDVRVGSGRGNRGKIRYPRKGHKNAWKKFYKLFPHLHPDYKVKGFSETPTYDAQKILNKKH